MGIMKDYNEALEAIYKHVGFVEDWVVYPILDRTPFYWMIDPDEKIIRFAEDKETLYSDGDYFEDDVIKHRFYNTSVYRGEDLTMIFVDTHTDGDKFFAIFANDSEVGWNE